MGVYTTLDSSPSFSEIRSAFGKSGQTSLNTVHTTFRYPRGSSSNISLNTFYRSLAYWHISVGHPYHTTTNTSGWGNGISAVTISVGGTNIKVFNSGTVWNSSEETYVMANNSYSTFTVTATVAYGYTFFSWDATITQTSGTSISSSNPATITASSYVELRPIHYSNSGGGGGA